MRDKLELGTAVFDKLKSYNYQLFKVPYHPWSSKCKGPHGQSISINDFRSQIYSDSYQLLSFTDSTRWIIACVLILKIILVLIPQKNKCRIVIRLVAFCLEVAAYVLLVLMYTANDNNYILELA